MDSGWVLFRLRLRPRRGRERGNHFRPAQAGPDAAPDRRDLHRQPPDYPVTSATHTYDDAGNITSDGVRHFDYNPNHRLARVRAYGATIAEYAYDAFDRRVKKVADGVTTHFHYDLNGLLISETDGNGNPRKDYVYLNGEPVAMKTYGGSAGWYWFINDHLGTPQKMVDATGSVVWAAAYAPFGEPRVYRDEITNNLRFPGQYYDVETGLHYNWHRYYDPETGRYLTPDPIGLAGGLNLYAYVRNDPVNSFDPFGLIELILVGQNKADPSYFTNIAKDWSGGKSKIIQVSNLQDVQKALDMPNITRLTYLGHASNEYLYLSMGNALASSDLPYLNKSNLSQRAEIELNGCKTAKGDNSIAQNFANYFNRNTYGWETGLSFGYYIPNHEKMGILLPSAPRNEGSLFGNKSLRVPLRSGGGL